MQQDPAQIALRHLLDQITALPGSRILVKRRLAVLIGCNRRTIRAALHISVVRGGESWQHVGKGSFRGHAPVDQAPSRAFVTIRSALNLMEGRLLLEPGIVAIAALRAPPQDLRLLQA